MSAYSYALSIYPSMYGVKTPAPMRTKAKICFAEFVRPDGYWPQPYSIEQAFQVYRWLVVTGTSFSRYQKYGAIDMLIGGGVMGGTDLHYEPIRQLKQLREVFHRAILGRSNGQLTTAWRAKERIAFSETRMIHFPHYAPFVGTPLLGSIWAEAQIAKLLNAYLSASGNLLVQLNKYHPGAIEIVEPVIRVQTWEPFDFVFDLGYGYEGSIWWHELARGSQFIDAFGEALTEFERVSGQRVIAWHGGAR